jgi:acetyl-CoA carboxylase alpha subunit
MSASLKAALLKHLEALESIPRDELRAARSRRIASFGVYSESAE